MAPADEGPRIACRQPGPDRPAPSGTRTFVIGFDRPMDRRRGRVRLSWGRLRFFTQNLAMPRYAWGPGAPELLWNEAGNALSLTLPEPICDGFRVRIEWSDLVGASDGRPPIPRERELGPSYVVAVLREGAGEPPRWGALPPSGSTGIRRDLVLELYPDQPIAEFPPGSLTLLADGQPVPFDRRTNRNPPDWIYLHPRVLLPPRARIEVVAGAGLRTTLGAPVPTGVLAAWTTGTDSPVPAEPVAAWSEPPHGFAAAPTDTFEGALRFAGQPILRAAQELPITLEQDGRPVPGLRIACDPTPAHYRTVFLSAGTDFPGLAPGRPCTLRWGALGAFSEGRGGAWTFWPSDPPGPLAPCPHVTCIATESGTLLQAALQVFPGADPVHGEVELRDGGGRWPLAAQDSPTFRDAVDGAVLRRRPILLSTLAAAPTLPPRSGPGVWPLRFHLFAGPVVRTFEALGFDLTGAVTDVVLSGGRRPSARWSLGCRVDSHHVSVHTVAGRTAYAGLLPGEATSWRLPRGWDLPPGRYVLQLWTQRARPEDDLWDHAVVERVVDVPCEPTEPGAAE